LARAQIRPTKKEMEADYEWEGCFGKRAPTAPSLRCIGRLQHSVLIKNGRSWRKHPCGFRRRDRTVDAAASEIALIATLPSRLRIIPSLAP
jgi:hypothetical protein